MLRHPSNPHASKVSRRVELMTTALKTVRRVTTKIPRERLVVMSACAHRKRNWGENERREENLFHQCERVYRCRADRALLRRRWGAAIVAEMIALCHATTNALRHPSNPRASKVSRRVELMTTALKTVRRVTTKNPRERLVVMTAGARIKGVGERVRDEKRD